MSGLRTRGKHRHSRGLSDRLPSWYQHGVSLSSTEPPGWVNDPDCSFYLVPHTQDSRPHLPTVTDWWSAGTRKCGEEKSGPFSLHSRNQEPETTLPPRAYMKGVNNPEGYCILAWRVNYRNSNKSQMSTAPIFSTENREIVSSSILFLLRIME